MLSGNGMDESSSSCVYQMLAESLVGMKFSLKNEIEGFSLSIRHEASGKWKHQFLHSYFATSHYYNMTL
jgi:hypothetical protein